MAYGFAGGVRDAEGRRGYVAVGPGEVAAVELEHGTVLWHDKGVGRPLAATSRHVLTLDRDGKEFVLRFLDALTGMETSHLERFGMPNWADEAGTAGDAVQIETSENPAGIEVAWRVRRPFRGGAPPPAQIAAQMHDVSVGAVLVDPESGRTSPAPAPPSLMEEATPVQQDLGPHASPAPNILAMGRVGDRLFELKAQAGPGGSVRVALEARDARGGSTIWNAPLAQIEGARPTPLRK